MPARIVVAEDDLEMLLVIVEALRADGHDVEPVSHGEQLLMEHARRTNAKPPLRDATMSWLSRHQSVTDARLKLVSTSGGRDRRAKVSPLAPGPVPRTLLIPLWARAAETRKDRPIVRDPRALEICERIDFDFATFRRAYGTQIGCVLRGLLYDLWVADFLARHPGGTIVELGAGLGTRFERIDDGRARWIDIDLPDAIALRRQHFEPSARRAFLAASVLDPSWPELVRRIAPGPYYFVSEGMLMYLEPSEVRGLLVRLADAFGPCEIALDSIASVVVRHQDLHDTMKHMMDAPFRWGVNDVREIEQWDPRLRVREVATLPDIAARFPDRVPLAHRLTGAVVRRTLPWFARSYRLSRVAIGDR